MDKGISAKKGSIVCVGIGMTLGSHITPLAKSYLEEADVVFVLVSDGVVEQWIFEMNDDVRSLQKHYHEGSSRRLSYEQMVTVLLEEVYNGKKVVGAFYGHPSVFACVPHIAISQALAKGYYAKMEPGISAEDCLYADLHIDPGEFGCAHFEASQFMFFKRNIDNSAYLILWQVAIAGDTTLSQFSTDIAYRQILIELLCEYYPDEHQVILYEAPTLPIHQPRKESLALSALACAKINQQTTLVIPPSNTMKPNNAVYEKLSALSKRKHNLQLV